MIICGFPGVGKSFCAKNIPRVVDFENKVLRCDNAKELMVSVFNVLDVLGYDVLLDVRLVDILKSENIDFTVVVPDINIKDEYIARYKSCGKSDKFIKDMSFNWRIYINKYLTDYDIKLVTLTEGQYLSNKFLKWSKGFRENFDLSLVNRNELKEKLRAIDSIDWEQNNPREEVFSIIDSLHEYDISRGDSVRA